MGASSTRSLDTTSTLYTLRATPQHILTLVLPPFFAARRFLPCRDDLRGRVTIRMHATILPLE